MKKYKAIFFDRDGTISTKNQEKLEKRDEYLSKVLGEDKFEVTPKISGEAMNRVVKKAPELDFQKNLVNTIEKENRYWELYFKEILLMAGYKGNIETEPKKLNKKFSFTDMLQPYPETEEVFRYFKDRGYKIGIISDTFPSLQATIEKMNLGRYVDSYTSSSIVGVFKPEPKIYIQALKSLNVTAKESIYVDDYKVESDGARDIGFTSFHIDRKRKGECCKKWEINNLKDLIDYVEKY
ncbi:HAD family hydrolase [Dethiothermospora halolimnae]|uniref:HAD family hydrolase n=1 Tax=Dethiothermospora halolimnae TaxID=3114390 RepID=UPI003CCBE57B